MKLLCAVLAVAGPVFGASYAFPLRADNTRVAWTLGDVLHTVHGTFPLKSGNIAFHISLRRIWISRRRRESGPRLGLISLTWPGE